MRTSLGSYIALWLYLLPLPLVVDIDMVHLEVTLVCVDGAVEDVSLLSGGGKKVVVRC